MTTPLQSLVSTQLGSRFSKLRRSALYIDSHQPKCASPVGATQGAVTYAAPTELAICGTDESSATGGSARGGTNRTPLRGLAIPDPSSEKSGRHQWLKRGVIDTPMDNG